MPIELRFRTDRGTIAFRDPIRIFRTHTTADTIAALNACDAALADGWWLAGELRYEGGATLGVFRTPAPVESDGIPFAFSPLMPTIDRVQYRAAIDSIRRDIYDGEVYQVNYTVPFRLSLEGDAASAWHAIAAQTGASFQAFFTDARRHVLSWSPEAFLIFDGETIRARPMKGTAPADRRAAVTNEKNHAEHVMIVDLLRNDLHRVARDVTVEALCTVEDYPSFSTMTSTIRADGVNPPVGRIYAATFPSGSVTGAPKRAAMTRIGRLESERREAYCGSLGFLSPQRQGWWNVAIRTAQFEGSIGRFDVGGGIVSDSEPDDEWREIETKSAFLRERCEPLELWETFAADAPDAIVSRHLQRLYTSAERLHVPIDENTLRKAVARARSSGQIVRLRVDAAGVARAMAEAAAAPHEPVSIWLGDVHVDSRDPWLHIKSAWRPAHRRAFTEATAHGCFDALMCNERGELTEGTRTNLFVELDGALFTPPLECGLLPGILRERLLADGVARERILVDEDLTRATIIYVGNSARGLLRARVCRRKARVQLAHGRRTT
jgi:para-aminobenzoate synthetase/4-amino-4-deoxychorismate lyase